MGEIDDLKRARAFIRSLEFGSRIECYLRRRRDRRLIVTKYELKIMSALMKGESTHTHVAYDIDSAQRNTIVALSRMASRGIVETNDGQLWKLTEIGRESMTQKA